MIKKKNFWLVLSVLVIVAMTLGACAPKEVEPPAGEAPAATQAAPVEAPAAAEKPKEPLIVAFGYYGTVDDGDYTNMMYNNVQIVQEHFGDQVKTIDAESIPFGAEAERTFEQFVTDGATFLVDTADFGDATEAVAARHPEIMLEKYAGWVTNDNSAGWWFMDGKLMYLQGIAAGMLTETNQLGFLGPWSAGYVKAWLNAFTLGAQSVNPDVTVHAIMYGSYFDPPAARQATEALIASGVDVITGYQMEPTTYQVAEAAGVWAMGGQEGTGIEGSRLSFAPTKFVTCLNEHYEGYLIKRIQMALDGTWVGNKQLTMLPIGEEGVDLCEFGPNVPQEVIDKVREVRQKFIDGEFKILGPIYNNKGNIVIADGVELTDNEFWMGLEWVAQGVKGMEE